MDNRLAIYTLYGKDTKDYPGEFVVRRFWVGEGGTVEPDKELFMRAENVQQIHHKLETEMGLIYFVRSPEDDPVIIGSFM